MAEMEGTRLKVARKRRGMTVKELAKKTGIHWGMLRDWEDCKTWCSSEDAIQKIATALNFPYGFFFGDEIELLDPKNVSF